MIGAVAALMAIAALAALGVVHHLGIMAMRRLIPPAQDAPHKAALLAFLGLAALHLTEIAGFAALYGLLDGWAALGHISGKNWQGTWVDLLHFSGTVFTTLGKSDISAEGALRLVVSAQALGGFMVITWSATFIYTLWGRAWDQ